METSAIVDLVKDLMADNAARTAFYDNPERVVATAAFQSECGTAVKDVVADEACEGPSSSGVKDVNTTPSSGVKDVFTEDDAPTRTVGRDNFDQDTDISGDGDNQVVNGRENQVVSGHDNNVADQDTSGAGSPAINGDGNIVVPIANGDILSNLIGGDVIGGDVLNTGGGSLLDLHDGILSSDTGPVVDLSSLVSGPLTGLAPLLDIL